MTRWISHLLGIDVTIEPLSELRDANLTWYVGTRFRGHQDWRPALAW